MRPVVASGANVDPSKETRDHLILEEDGLITVTGGKLTTFRSTAVAALQHAAARVPKLKSVRPDAPLFAPLTATTLDALYDAPQDLGARWITRYGDKASGVKSCVGPGEMLTIRHTGTAWAELRWACRSEQVVHLDDLMLRRTRLGLLLRKGAADLLPRVKAIVQEELGWTEIRWNEEVAAYRALIARCYSVPGMPA